MIDWIETEKILGYTIKSRIPKSVKIVCRCDECSQVVYVTKQIHYLYVRRAGLFRCKECGRKANILSSSKGIKKKWEDPEYRNKRSGFKHSKKLKEQARKRALELWQDQDYIKKYYKNFDKNIAINNLKKINKDNQVAGLMRYWDSNKSRKLRSNLSSRMWQNDDYRNKVISSLKCYYSSSEVLNKCSEKAKKLWENDDYRQNWLKSFIDSFTSDRINEISKQSLLNWCDSNYRGKIESNWTDEKKRWMSEICQNWWSDDKRSDLSSKMISMWADNEIRERFVVAFREAWTEDRRQRSRDSWTDEMRQKIRDSWTDEMRQKASERARSLWQNPDYVKKMLEVGMRPSSLEVQFAAILDDYNIKYKQQANIGPYLFDFELDDGTLIEIQGDYWHTLKRNIIKDKAKSTYIENYFPDRKLLYLWEHEFYELDKVRNFVESLVSKPVLIDFNFNDLLFDCDVDYNEAKSLIEKYHYKGSLNRSGLICGARLNDKLIAVCIFSSPTRNVDGGELTRFVIHPKYQKKNLGSWTLSRSTKKALEKWDNLFTFSDPNFNHNGTLYLASNWKYVGESKPDYWYTSDNGWIMHKKTLWNRAKNLCKKESEYAELFGYRKVWGLPKKKYTFTKF